jgi:hypothetical protein
MEAAAQLLTGTTIAKLPPPPSPPPAPPKLSQKNMQCKIDGHNKDVYRGVCLLPTCEHETRFTCYSCLVEVHQAHTFLNARLE